MLVCMLVTVLVWGAMVVTDEPLMEPKETLMPISTRHNTFTYNDRGCVVAIIQTIHWTRVEMARAYASAMGSKCYHSEHVTITTF